MPWWLLAVGPALAADALIPIPFSPPADVPLFLKADVVSVRSTWKGPDCAAAVADALAQAGARGTVVRVVVSPTDLTAAAQAPCKQRKAGDTISASVVDLTAVVVVPGAPVSVYPVIGAERAAQIAGMIGAVAGGGLSSAAIDDIDGRAWVRLGQVVLPDTLDPSQLDDNARATRAYDRTVPEWISRWATVLATLPEVQGAVLEVQVTSEDPSVKKSRRTELFRFAVPTPVAQAFLKGDLADDQLLAASRVERATDPKKRNFELITLDVIEGDLAVEGEHGKVERAGLDVKEEDLEGVEDEE